MPLSARRILYYYVAGAVLVGCANDEAVLAARLEECGLLTEGEVGPISLTGVYAPDGCYQSCLAQAECDRLADALCRTELELLIACDERCAHRCADGTLIGVERRCDGATQCTDGSDEAGCPGSMRFRCDDGVERWGRRCDGVYACPDGLDERGCSYGVLLCDGGRSYGAWDRCNGYSSCSDGADEAGCPSYECASGLRVLHREGESPRCNGWSECGDGSDEAGCARLTLSCSF